MTGVFRPFHPVRTAQLLFVLNAVIWVVFGGVTLFRMAGGSMSNPMALLIIAVMMVGNAAAMIVSALGLGRQQRGFYYLALAVLLVNIVLTVTDEFGVFDLITLIIDLVLLGILLTIQKHYR